jgi:nucleolar protein 4
LYEAISALAPAGRVALLSAPNKHNAEKIQEALAGKPLKALLRPIIGESTDSLPHGSVCLLRKLTDVTEPALRRRKCRLIIRNLSFQANEQNVMDKMERFGPVVEVLLPRVEIDHSNDKEQHDRQSQRGKGQKRSRSDSKDGEGDVDAEVGRNQSVKLKPRGYAFVTFLCEADAATAVNASSGLKICNREVAVDYCTSKDFYEKGYAHELAGTSAAKALEGTTDANAGAEELAALKANENDETENDDQAEDDGDASAGEGEDDEEDNDSEDDVSASKESKTNVNDADEGRTVFLRDLAFDTSKEDVEQALSQFGKVVFVAVVRDPHTHMCKGSAFVKFGNVESALACVRAVDAQASAPASQLSSQKLLICDRPFRADIAMNKQEAQQFQDDSNAKDGKGKPKMDKRNLYLANEGLNTQSGTQNLLTNEEREKRVRAQNEKKKKLMNPLFFVSPTRYNCLLWLFWWVSSVVRAIDCRYEICRRQSVTTT